MTTNATFVAAVCQNPEEAAVKAGLLGLRGVKNCGKCAGCKEIERQKSERDNNDPTV